MLGKVGQSRFGMSDRLEIHLDHVRMPDGNGREKMKGRSLDVMNATKKGFVKVKAGFLCLAHSLIWSKVNADPKYKSYRNGYSLKQPVQDLSSASSVDLTNGGCFKELEQLQNYFSDYKFIVYDSVSPDVVLFNGNSLSNKKL